MGRVSRPYSVFVHFVLGRNVGFSNVRSGNKVMGITEEGRNIIWMRKICGELREGDFCFGCGSLRVFSSGNPEKWGAYNLDLSENTIWSDIEEGYERRGRRKASAPSYKEVETATEIQQILKNDYKKITNLYLRSSLISENVVFVVMEREKNVKLVFSFFLWVARMSCFRRNLDLIMLMSDILEKSREFGTAWDLLREVKGRKVLNMVQAAPFTVLIRAYAKASLVEKAIDTFSLMEKFSCKPDILTWNAILDIFVREEMIDVAVALYRRMLKMGSRPNYFTFDLLIRGFCNAGNLEDAHDLIDKMREMELTPTFRSCAIILKCHCEANNMDEAFRLFDLMKRSFSRLDIMVYNIIIDGLCEVHQVDSAFEFLHELKDNNIAPDKYTYSSLLHGIFKAGRFDEACKYYRDLLKDHITPCLVLYTVMINAFCDAGRIDYAFQIWSTMSRNKCPPDAFCYNTLMKGICKVGMFDKAYSLKLEMSQKGLLDTVTYTTLICELCDQGFVEEAHDMLEEMKNNGYVIDVSVCNKVIGILCEACDDSYLQKACVLFCKMEMGNDPSLFISIAQGSNNAVVGADLQALADGHCGIGRVLVIYKLYKRLMKSGPVPNVATYTLLIGAFFKAGKLDRALKLYEAMHLKGYILDVITYNVMIDGLCKAGEIDGAFKIFEAMHRKGCIPGAVTYNTLIDGLCKAGEIDRALNFFESMHRKGCIPNVVTYNILIDGLWRVDRNKDAFTLFREMAGKGCSPDFVTYNTLMTSLCQKGTKIDIPLALNLWVNFISQRYSINYQTLSRIQTFLDEGNIEEAVRIVVHIDMKQNSSHSGAYSVLIIGLCKVDRLDAALTLYAAVQENNLDISAPAYAHLIFSLYEKDDVLKSLEIFGKSLKKGISVQSHILMSVMYWKETLSSRKKCSSK